MAAPHHPSLEDHRALLLEVMRELRDEQAKAREQEKKSIGTKIGPWITIVLHSLMIFVIVSSGLGGLLYAAKDQLIDSITQEVSARVTRLEARQELEPELRDFVRARCMGQLSFSLTFDRLKRAYALRVGEPYVEPDCARLLVP